MEMENRTAKSISKMPIRILNILKNTIKKQKICMYGMI